MRFLFFALALLAGPALGAIATEVHDDPVKTWVQPDVALHPDPAPVAPVVLPGLDVVRSSDAQCLRTYLADVLGLCGVDVTDQSPRHADVARSPRDRAWRGRVAAVDGVDLPEACSGSCATDGFDLAGAPDRGLSQLST